MPGVVHILNLNICFFHISKLGSFGNFLYFSDPLVFVHVLVPLMVANAAASVQPINAIAKFVRRFFEPGPSSQPNILGLP